MPQNNRRLSLVKRLASRPTCPILCEWRTGLRTEINACVVYIYDLSIINDVLYIIIWLRRLITAGQLKASRALLGIDQRKLAEAARLSLPTIQRMEASEGVIRGNVDSLMKLADALDALGIELISDNAVSQGGGRGVRFKRTAS